MFPGQGAQAGITKDLWTPDTDYIFKQGNDALRPELGRDITDIIFGEDKELLKRTDIAQPAILLTSLARYHQWKEKGLAFEIGVGDSFGEYAMLVAAKAMELKDAVRLVHWRGKYMRACRPDETPDKDYSFMVAVMNTEEGTVRKACSQVPFDLGIAELAKINAESQIVIAGNIPALKYATGYLTESGLSKKYIIPLEVDAPFHCRLMLPAEYKLSNYIEQVEIKKPSTKVFMTYSGRIEEDPARIKNNLVKQTSRTVYLSRAFERLVSWGKRVFVESGPGKVITKLLKRRKDVEVIEEENKSIEDKKENQEKKEEKN